MDTRFLLFVYEQAFGLLIFYAFKICMNSSPVMVSFS